MLSLCRKPTLYFSAIYTYKTSLLYYFLETFKNSSEKSHVTTLCRRHMLDVVRCTSVNQHCSFLLYTLTKPLCFIISWKFLRTLLRRVMLPHSAVGVCWMLFGVLVSRLGLFVIRLYQSRMCSLFTFTINQTLRHFQTKCEKESQSGDRSLPA